MRRALLLCSLLLLGACAQARVEPLAAPAPGAAPAERLPRPALVVVEPFRLDPARVTLDSAPVLRVQRMITDNDAARRATAAREAVAGFQAALLAALRERGVAAVPVSQAGTALPRLTIGGEFSALEEGNRARRAVVGFGLGASRVAGEAQLGYLAAGAAPRVVDAFALSADSGRMPGGVVGAGMGAQAVAAGTAIRGAVGEARGPQEIGALARGTADRIVAVMDAQGWR